MTTKHGDRKLPPTPSAGPAAPAMSAVWTRAHWHFRGVTRHPPENFSRVGTLELLFDVTPRDQVAVYLPEDLLRQLIVQYGAPSA